MKLEDFQEAEGAEWRIEWSDNDPQSRTTTMSLIAWFAKEHDPEATVYRIDGEAEVEV